MYRYLLLFWMLLVSSYSGICQTSGVDHFNYAFSFLERQMPDSAMHHLSIAIALDSSMSNAWYNRGVVRANYNDYSGAVADFEQCVRLEPMNGQAYNNLGLMLLKLNVYQKGCHCLRVARDYGIPQGVANYNSYCKDYKE
jgi:Tfp pilus assembly protein PilF